MITKPRGLYVHIPFCLKKCNYCDFCSYGIDECHWVDKYIEVLCREIESYSDKQISIDTIFFGGGTPSLLKASQFNKISEKIRESFILCDDVEFTIEANPKTLTKEKLLGFMSCGVNRLSIGLQSIHENEQKILGRVHNYQDFLSTYKMAREVGINNINVDLMYGIPEQTKGSFLQTLRSVLDLSPEHISLYGLILEEGTPFYKMRDSLNLPTEDEECDMYYLAADILCLSGYNHYEISNYAREGYFCRHNLKYWHSDEYIGVGLAAYSYYDNVRYGNTGNAAEYLDGKFAQYDSGQRLDAESKAYEFVMLSLRLSEGFSLSEYKNSFGFDFIEGREEFIKNICNQDLAVLTDDRFYLTEKGFYVSNNILTELL